MLGIYNQNFNNMYINQNYGFSQSVMNFSQQSSVFSNFRNQQSSFNLNSLMSFFGSNINHSVKRNTSHKKPVTVDETTVKIEPKKEPVHGYTALHQSLAWGEASAKKMWSLYDANKDGILDHDEDAALRATFTQGSSGIWTDKSCKQMIGQNKTPNLFYENLKNIKSLSNKEDNLYYKTAVSDFENNWKNKPGSV